MVMTFDDVLSRLRTLTGPSITLSAPIPAGFTKTAFPSLLTKADVNHRQGIITAYLTVYNNDDGTPFIDPYRDIIQPGAFSDTIKTLEADRRARHGDFLCPHLWQHDSQSPIGGVKGLTEDTRGVVYETHLAMGVQRAREALELAEKKMLGSSYGYDPIGFQMLPGNIRKLTSIGLRETSSVTFPANPLANILDVKTGWTTTHLRQSSHGGGLTAIDAAIARIPKPDGADAYTMQELDKEWRKRRNEAYNNNRHAYRLNSRFGG